MAILINQSVAILCDGNNIERSIHEQSHSTNTMINFDKLIPKLLKDRGLNRLIYFREGKSISSKLAERLYEKYYGSVEPCHKSADIPLSIKATQLASKVDTIIILSGDSDYVELVRHLKGEGVRVEIAAVKKTTARILIEEADYFQEITPEDWFVYNKPNYKKQAFKKRSHKKPEFKKQVQTQPVLNKPVHKKIKLPDKPVQKKVISKKKVIKKKEIVSKKEVTVKKKHIKKK